MIFNFHYPAPFIQSYTYFVFIPCSLIPGLIVIELCYILLPFFQIFIAFIAHKKYMCVICKLICSRYIELKLPASISRNSNKRPRSRTYLPQPSMCMTGARAPTKRTSGMTRVSKSCTLVVEPYCFNSHSGSV